MVEILVHSYDDEPCDMGLDRFDDRTCGHGVRAHLAWIDIGTPTAAVA